MKSGPKVAIILSVVLLLSMLAPPVVASNHNDIPDDETFRTNSVDVWEESIFTFRHDFEDAPTAVETGDFRAGLGTGGNATLNRDFLGVRTAGDEVTLSYNPNRAQLSNADLSGNNVQVIAARVTGSGEPVTTFTEAVDLISQENANSNATFEEVESDQSLNSGETTFTHTGDAGHYVYFVVDKSTGEFSVDNGDIEIATETPTIIGVEQITFQRGSPATVSAPAISEPGEDLSFDLDTTNQFAEDNVTHTVMVYDQSKFSDINQGKFTIQVSDRSEINEDFNLSEDAELFHEINEVNGVADVEDGIEVNGIDISDGRVSRAVSLGSVVDFVAEDIDGNDPDTTATGDVRLDASVTADAQRDRDHTVTVETADDWETGSYRYVYVGALENNASAVTTSTGTISVEEDVDVESQASNSVDSGGASIVNLGSNDVSRTEFRGLKPGSTASVAQISSPPRSVTARPDSVGTPRYLEINAETQGGSNATVEVTVNKNQFSNVSNAQVFRYDGSQFVGLSTSVVSQTSSDVTLEFETGFSLFAVGERQSPTSPSNPGSPGGGGGGGGGGGSSSATFTVSNLTPQDVEVTQGEEITVTATVTTSNFLEDTQDVDFRIDGDTVATQSVSLQDRQSTTVEFTGIDTSNLEGEFEHGVFTEDDSQTATLTVTAPADDGADEDDEPADGTDQDDGAEEDDDQPTDGDAGTDGETDDGTPGFGPLVALVALVAAALLAARRER